MHMFALRLSAPVVMQINIRCTYVIYPVSCYSLCHSMTAVLLIFSSELETTFSKLT